VDRTHGRGCGQDAGGAAPRRRAHQAIAGVTHTPREGACARALHATAVVREGEDAPMFRPFPARVAPGRGPQ
jgi:hypothetical protein